MFFDFLLRKLGHTLIFTLDIQYPHVVLYKLELLLNLLNNHYTSIMILSQKFIVYSDMTLFLHIFQLIQISKFIKYVSVVNKII